MVDFILSLIDLNYVLKKFHSKLFQGLPVSFKTWRGQKNKVRTYVQNEHVLGIV